MSSDEHQPAPPGQITDQLRQSIIDLCWAVTPYGEDEDGWITRYLVSAGPVHNLIGAAQGAGIGAAFRACTSNPPEDASDPLRYDGSEVGE